MKKVLCVLLLAAACGKSSDKAGGDKPAAPTIDVAAVNALVPADLKAKLVFEKQDIIEERHRKNVTYTMAAPKGWAPRMKGFAGLKGPDDAGFFTSLDVGSNCDGTCEPKDWAKVADKVNFAQFANDKVIKNEAGANSRLLVAEAADGKTTHVVYAWWTAGAKRYNTCTATLDTPVKAAGEAFAKACQSIGVSGDD